jgi:hypothetical protein
MIFSVSIFSHEEDLSERLCSFFGRSSFTESNFQNLLLTVDGVQ